MKITQKLSMAICVLFGFVYFGWIAWSEGWGFWLLATLVSIVAGVGVLIHRTMDSMRQR